MEGAQRIWATAICFAPLLLLSAEYSLERRGNGMEAFADGRRFAVLSPAESGDWKIDADASRGDFIRFWFTPAAGRTGTFRFPEIRLDGDGTALKAVGSQGFTTLADTFGSAMYLAAAEPSTRRGVVYTTVGGVTMFRDARNGGTFGFTNAFLSARGRRKANCTLRKWNVVEDVVFSNT